VLHVDFVIRQAESLGLAVERVANPRQLYIARQPVQVMLARLGAANSKYAHAKSLDLYLPRREFPAFLIYVTEDQTPDFYILPRGVLSHDTSMTTESLQPYRNAWGLLSSAASHGLTERHFTAISPVLEAVVSAAQVAGLESQYVTTRNGLKKPGSYRTVFQRRVLIAGRRCQVYSAVRVDKHLPFDDQSVVNLKAPTTDWSEFNLYLIEDGSVFVFPRDGRKGQTTMSLSSPEFENCRDAWHLLSASAKPIRRDVVPRKFVKRSPEVHRRELNNEEPTYVERDIPNDPFADIRKLLW
jgi:hypothetical protein